jgi:hypothetical protein
LKVGTEIRVARNLIFAKYWHRSPICGGSYVADTTTVAGATSVTGVAQGPVPVTGQRLGRQV